MQKAPQRNGSLKITDHPTDRSEIDCQTCNRSRRYRKVTLIKKHSSNTVLPDLMGILASDWEFRGRLGNEGCEAIYPALARIPKYNPSLKIV